MTSVDSVIILGAGASASDGAPLQNDLIKEFCRYALVKKLFSSDKKFPVKGISEAEKIQLDQIERYFVLFWGADLFSSFDRRFEYPTFEDCLGILDIAKNRNENFKLKNREELNNFRNSLIFLIAKAIEEKLENSKSNNHKKLIERLKRDEILQSTSFISLNYDIIIDDSLTRLRDSDQIDLDYGIEFMNFDRDPDLTKNSWSRSDPTKSILLLKPHGSLNWLYCPTCNQIEITPWDKIAVKVFTESKECVACGTPMEPIIVPPTYFKEMHNVYLQQIFQKSDKILMNSKKIFLCGYSLPDADLHIKYLLKRAELLNRNSPEIFIINNHEKKKGADAKREEKRFLQFFKNKDKVKYTELSFEDFCRDGI
jgi:hypothetical protein